ncbi:MAG: threonine/serine dehydratase [Gemmatimonadales bacterium]|nr:threonine/serine dehydratase [Gemmatimonadales bacterium]
MTATAVPTITRDDLARTAAALRDIAVRTPLVESAELTRRFGTPVWVKCELHQPIGAFKLRGAYTAISRLAPEVRARGIITHSSGNHGQAVAYVAKHFGVRAVIVMPETAPQVKVDGIRRHGAEIVFTTKKERERKAQELIDREGLVMVAPYDNLDVIMGQGTCAYEILEDQPGVETMIVPIGGGGMLAGTCAAVAAIKPSIAVWAVEPALSPKLSAALQAGRPVPFDPVDTLADGLVPPSTGAITFEYIRPVVRGAVTLTEAEIAAGVHFLFHSMGLRVEPSGATPVAALLAGKVVPTGPTACILTGGNVDPSVFTRLVA